MEGTMGTNYDPDDPDAGWLADRLQRDKEIETQARADENAALAEASIRDEAQRVEHEVKLYLARIGKRGGSAGRGAAKSRTSANVAGAVRQILARVRRQASAEGARYDAGCGAHPLPDGRCVEVRLASASDGGMLLGVREYRVADSTDSARWRRL